MHGRWETHDPVFRILALDGGGIRGIFTASFLATVEDLSRKRLADYFDLIVGTSTGGIIGLALAFGIPARRILGLYIEWGPRIFGRPRCLGMMLRPKHDSRLLERVLREMFGNLTLDESLTPVCIPSYELTNAYPRVWKDEHGPAMSWWGDQPAWKIALATSAAPLYFAGAQVVPGDSHIDGGLFANNPTLVGIAEAVHYFGQPLERIRILSIGAGERAARIPHERARRMGVWQWRTAVYEHLLLAQARVAHEIASHLLAPGQYARVNIPLEQAYALDDHRAARTLIEPGAQEARTRLLDLGDRFLFAPATLGRDQKTAFAGRRNGRGVTGGRPTFIGNGALEEGGR